MTNLVHRVPLVRICWAHVEPTTRQRSASSAIQPFMVSGAYGRNRWAHPDRVPQNCIHPKSDAPRGTLVRSRSHHTGRHWCRSKFLASEFLASVQRVKSYSPRMTPPSSPSRASAAKAWHNWLPAHDGSIHPISGSVERPRRFGGRTSRPRAKGTVSTCRDKRKTSTAARIRGRRSSPRCCPGRPASRSRR